MTPQELREYFRKNRTEYTRVYDEVVQGFKGSLQFGVGAMPNDPSEGAIEFEHGYLGLQPKVPSAVTINGQTVRVVVTPLPD